MEKKTSPLLSEDRRTNHHFEKMTTPVIFFFGLHSNFALKGLYAQRKNGGSKKFEKKIMWQMLSRNCFEAEKTAELLRKMKRN